MEAPNVLKQKNGSSDEVTVVISGDDETSKMKKESKVLELEMPYPPGISRQSPKRSQTSNPASDTDFRQRPTRISIGCRPKSRIVESSYPPKAKVVEESSGQTVSSPYNGGRGVAGFGEETKKSKTPGSITPKIPLMASLREEGEEDDDDDDDNEVYTAAGHALKQVVEMKKHGKNVKFLIWIEWIAFFSLVGILIASLCINKLKIQYIWGLHIWRWCVLILVVFCGHLVTQWLMDVLEFFLERNFLLKKKVLYFVYGLRKSARVSIWLALILLTWTLLIHREVKKSRKNKKVLNYITRGIASTLIGALLCLAKTFLVKLLASSFHVKTFFDRIQESIFHQYVLHILSGPPSLKYGGSALRCGRLSFQQSKKTGKKKESGEETIDVNKLCRMKKKKVSAWTMGGLVKVITSSGLSTFSELIDETEDNEGVLPKEITSEFEAKVAAKLIFKKVAKPGNKYIEEEDLLLFMPREEAFQVLQMFEGAAESGRIKKADFKSWVVKVYHERKYLAHSLNDTKTAVEELNRLVSVITFVIAIVVWLLLMGIATTQVLVFISSQLLLVVFMFGNSAKTVFEAIIFVFVTHPFDVGDKCVIDGVQLTVEEMNILTTIFLRYDNEKICYPNSILATKPISNFNRSPEMVDTLGFCVDFMTSVESIATLKARIKQYLESRPMHWRPGHSVAMKEIENIDKLKMALSVTHTVNFQSPEIGNRRSDLVLELKKILEDLDIKYHLLPQEVHLRYVGS